MPHDRFYADKSLNLDESFVLEDEEFHHLTHVMRTKVGDEVECFNGRGALARARVARLDKKAAHLDVLAVENEPPPSRPLVVAQAFARASKLDYIVEKGCELGMNALWLYRADYSEKGDLSPNQWTRLRHLSVMACKQSGQLWLPEIKLFPSLAALPLEGLTEYFGDTDPKAPYFEAAWKSSPPKKGALFAVGPEKGFSEKEEQLMKERGALGVRLTPLILRTETAPLAALALMSHWLYADL
jgi:16S rRNA (uracil1498-N3)-methyltransferase